MLRMRYRKLDRDCESDLSLALKWRPPYCVSSQSANSGISGIIIL